MVERADLKYFKTPNALRAWFQKNHQRAVVLHIGFYKKAAGKPSVTYHGALDEALCFGWIDGVRHAVDHDSYTIRFTPRRASSAWSLVNIRRVEELKKLRRMMAPGLKAYESRDLTAAKKYSYEREASEFDAASLRKFKANKKAWAFFQSQPPGYRRLATWFVVSAKRPETRERRLAALISDSTEGRRLGAVLSPGRRQSTSKPPTSATSGARTIPP